MKLRTDAPVMLRVLLMVWVCLVDQVELLLGDKVAHKRQATAELRAAASDIRTELRLKRREGTREVRK